MEKDAIQLEDISRMLFGNVPASFYIETFFRVLVIYILLVAAMRFMGNRMSSALTRNEMIAMVTLAGAIGIPIMGPDRGLIPPIIIAIIVVLTERGISAWSFKNQKVENVTQGDISLLVKEGVLQLKNMKKSRITRERLIAHLRSSGIKHLGKVKRLYLEAGGSFTLIRDERPGLSIIPDWDEEFLSRQEVDENTLVCHYCGKGFNEDENADCNNCDASKAVHALK